MSDTQTVHLTATFATLLSGNLFDCKSIDDESCAGGMAAVKTIIRNSIADEPSLIIPRIDQYSPFVQMHPLGWNVNRLVLRERFNLTVLASGASLVTNDNINDHDLSYLQTHELPLLLTNIAVPPSNSWHPFVRAVYFDESTKLAIISIVPANQDKTQPQIESALGSLDYIQKVNNDNGEQWVPVIFFAEQSPSRFSDFLQATVSHSSPPALVLDIEGNDIESYGNASLLNNKTWVASYRQSSRTLNRWALDKSTDGMLANVTGYKMSLLDLPPEFKDLTYASDIEYLSSLANEAASNDPIVGYSGFMPLTRDNYDARRCMGGECPIGNLFTDALRWYTDADFTFVTSGGLRGPGWSAGPVRVSDIWYGLPFPNNICTGVMSGVSLFKLLNYTSSAATFQSTYTSDGDRLLQVSGLKYTYNTQLNISRLIDVQVWNDTEEEYLPIERLRMYKFATDSWLCQSFDPYPELTSDLTIEGEMAGVVDFDELIHQFIVAEYLEKFFPHPNQPYYDTNLQGRLRNDTGALIPLNLIQTKDDCPTDSTWDEATATCVACPEQDANVGFSDEQLEFEAENGSKERKKSRVVLFNRELFPVTVVPKTLPSFVELERNSTEPIMLLSGESVVVDLAITCSDLETGTALGTVSFGVLDAGYQGCVGYDATFDVFVRIIPSAELNQLGAIRYVGLSLMIVAIISAIFFAFWVGYNRTERIVKTMQPPFLIKICFGVLVMATAIVPISIDDGIASIRGCDIACMATPWLLSIGFTISFAALLSKLWRINKLFKFGAALQRIKVKEKDVILPFLILFTLNLSFLLVWTVIDPLRWERLPVDGEPWNTYGICTGFGSVSKAMLGLTVAVNFTCLALACWQAYLARNICDDFQESKYLGTALFSWFQVFIVGTPILFLIDDDEPTVKYFITVVMIFIVCMSMLLLIFCPIIRNHRMFKKTGGMISQNEVHVSGIQSSIRSSLPGPPWKVRDNSSNLHENFGNIGANVTATQPSANNSFEKRNSVGITSIDTPPGRTAFDNHAESTTCTSTQLPSVVEVSVEFELENKASGSGVNIDSSISGLNDEMEEIEV